MAIYISALEEPFCNMDLGDTFNAKTNEKGTNAFETIQTQETRISESFFRCKVVKDKTDVTNLLDISGDVSLKVQAGILSVGGAGKYLNEEKKKNGVTEVCAVMRCKTVRKKVDDRTSTLRNDISSFKPERIGTHYVNTITYGGELVVTMRFKDSSITSRFETTADLKIESTAVTGGIKGHFEKVFKECRDTSDIEIQYYGTGQPQMKSITSEGLLELVETLPEKTKEIHEGQGVPVRLELQPITNIGTGELGIEYRKNPNLFPFMEEFKEQFQDLRSCSAHLKFNQQGGGDRPPDLQALYASTRKVLQEFNKAINNLGFVGDEGPFYASQEAYEAALNGEQAPGKFMAEWGKVMQKHRIVPKIELQRGKPLKLLLLGKTGNGKSSTANQIIGENKFLCSDSPTTCTIDYQAEERKGDRSITVIDTPDFMNTSGEEALAITEVVLKHLDGLKVVSEKLLSGVDAFLLVARYGERITDEEFKSMKMPLEIYREEVKQHMILVLTHGDKAFEKAQREKIPVENVVKNWLKTLPQQVGKFVSEELDGRVVLFDNSLPKVGAASEIQVEQVALLMEIIDKMMEKKEPFDMALLKQGLGDATDNSPKEVETRVGEGTGLGVRNNPEKKEPVAMTSPKQGFGEATDAFLKEVETRVSKWTGCDGRFNLVILGVVLVGGPALLIGAGGMTWRTIGSLRKRLGTVAATAASTALVSKKN